MQKQSGGKKIPYELPGTNGPKLREENLEDMDSELVGVFLSKFEVKGLYSKDGLERGMKEREGTLVITCNGQTLSLSWATGVDGKLKNTHKFSEQVLFFGKNRGLLDLTVEVVESDKDTVERLTKAKSLLGMLGSFAALVPGPGMIVGAGLSLLGGILDIARGGADADLEMTLLASCGTGVPKKGLKAGTYIAERPAQDLGKHGGVEKLGIEMVVQPINPLLSPIKYACIRLKKIKLNLEPDMERRTLVLDAAFGSGDATIKTEMKARVRNGRAEIDRIAAIRDKIVYLGPWNVGVPFSISMAGISEDKELEAMEGLIEASGSFAGVFTKNEDAKKLVENAAKAAQSTRACIVEFLPKKISVGTVSGFIGSGEMAPGAVTSGAEDLAQGMRKSKLLKNFYLADTLNEKQGEEWAIEVHSESGGAATFWFTIQAVASPANEPDGKGGKDGKAGKDAKS